MQTRDGFHRSFLNSPKKAPHDLIGDYHCRNSSERWDSEESDANCQRH
jgi:hypothetical protein